MLCVFILPVGFCFTLVPQIKEHKIDTFCDKVTFGFLET